MMKPAINANIIIVTSFERGSKGNWWNCLLDSPCNIISFVFPYLSKGESLPSAVSRAINESKFQLTKLF